MQPNQKPYIVERSNFDASRPWAVIRTFRNFNRIVQRYQDKAAAMRRARDMNKARSPRHV